MLQLLKKINPIYGWIEEMQLDGAAPKFLIAVLHFLLARYVDSCGKAMASTMCTSSISICKNSPLTLSTISDSTNRC